jgi:ParB-like chromosome segregation protein Spo0J
MNLLTQGIENRSVIPTTLTKKLSVDNHIQTYNVYKIRLDQLYYNDQNDRIATWISQYKAENGIIHMDTDDKEQYNRIIQGFITESNPEALKKTQNNIELIGQQEGGVVLTDGRIIDGNRRFTCLRNLEQKTGKTQYFEAVILMHDIAHNAKQIKMLELLLQHGVDKPVDYNPIDRLVGIYNDIVENKLLTVREYASSVNQTEADIKREVEKAKLMVEFLEFINAPKQFYLARTMNLSESLKDLYSMLSKVKNDESREDLKNNVFAQLLMAPVGDTNRYIRKIGKIASNSRLLDDYLAEQLDLTEKVCDALEQHPITTDKVINEHIRTKKEIQSEFARSTEKWISKADGDASRNRPAQQVEKAYEMLDTIDTNIFKKMSDEQKDDIREKLDLVQRILDSTRGELDV